MDEEVKDEDLDEEVEEINFQQVSNSNRPNGQNKPSENSFERKERSNSQNSSSKLVANTPRKHSSNDGKRSNSYLRMKRRVNLMLKTMC